MQKTIEIIGTETETKALEKKIRCCARVLGEKEPEILISEKAEARHQKERTLRVWVSGSEADLDRLSWECEECDTVAAPWHLLKTQPHFPNIIALPRGIDPVEQLADSPDAAENFFFEDKTPELIRWNPENKQPREQWLWIWINLLDHTGKLLDKTITDNHRGWVPPKKIEEAAALTESLWEKLKRNEDTCLIREKIKELRPEISFREDCGNPNNDAKSLGEIGAMSLHLHRLARRNWVEENLANQFSLEVLEKMEEEAKIATAFLKGNPKTSLENLAKATALEKHLESTRISKVRIEEEKLKRASAFADAPQQKILTDA